MTLEDRLEQVANHDWRVSMLAHTSDTAEEARATILRLKGWLADLQSGMYVNCVYCGHRYGPGETTPVAMADALKAHIMKCPEHPASAMRTMLIKAREMLLDQQAMPDNSLIDEINALLGKT